MALNIELGTFEGRERLYSNTHHIDILKRIAEVIATGYGNTPGRVLENVKVWYDRAWDYHVLEFNFDGDHYRIEYYKVFTATRNGDQEGKVGFHNREHNVWDYFLGGSMWGDFDKWRGRSPSKVA